MSTPKIVFEPAKDDSGKPCVQWQVGALGGYARTTEEAASDAITLIAAQRDALLEAGRVAIKWWDVEPIDGAELTARINLRQAIAHCEKGQQ